MAHDGEGTIYIPMEDFWAFVAKYAPAGVSDCEVRYGVPRATTSGSDLEIDYAFSSEYEPESWSKPPKAVLQWKELRAKTETP